MGLRAAARRRTGRCAGSSTDGPTRESGGPLERGRHRIRALDGSGIAAEVGVAVE